ncbi:MAG: hypothetical protein L0956_00930 [Candidatus Mariimomonas ferrooxydans]
MGYKFIKVLVNPVDIPAKSTLQIQVDKKNTAGRRKVNLNEGEYLVIARKDLFRPSRSAPESGDAFQISRPSESLKLFGTIIMNNDKIAIMENPYTKISKPYHLNDSISGFIITDIQKDKIIVLRGSEKIEIKLRDMKGFTTPSSTSSPKPLIKSKKPKKRKLRPPRKPTPRQSSRTDSHSESDSD